MLDDIDISTQATRKTTVLTSQSAQANIEATPPPSAPPDTGYPRQILQKAPSRIRPRSRTGREVANARMLHVRCRQLCLSMFFREHAPVHSLGITSAIGGEGKSFLAMAMAEVLARDSSDPVILLECNWEHQCLHEYFGFPAVPGVAEWLRGECSEEVIRHQVHHNLTVIPAGESRQDAVKLLQQMREQGLLDMLADSNNLLIVDLPAIISTAYGALAASLVEALIVVVLTGVTPDALITETCEQLKDLPVQGMVLNRVESRVPGWIRKML